MVLCDLSIWGAPETESGQVHATKRKYSSAYQAKKPSHGVGPWQNPSTCFD